MDTRRRRLSSIFLLGLGLALFSGCLGQGAHTPIAQGAGEDAAALPETTPPGAVPIADLPQSAAEWRQQLTPEQFRVAREKGTERPFTNAYCETKEPGVYRCIGCGVELFSSQYKYDSGTGWPSFTQPSQKAYVVEEDDLSLYTKRTEVHCRRCGAHLGHVFDDGPEPTGLRYCLNSAALRFDPAVDQKPAPVAPQAAKSAEESLFDAPALAPAKPVK